MYLIKERSKANYPALIASRELFHQAHALGADHVHVDGEGFSFDLEKVDNADYNPTYFTTRWKGQNAYFPYDCYDENALSSLYLPFLKRFPQVFISEVNEYTVVLTGLILKHTQSRIFITDDRIRWFYEPDERLRIVESFPPKDKKTLTINGLEQDLVFDMQFETMGPVGAFHNVFFLQGHGVLDLAGYQYADICLDKDAGIGSVLNTLSKCSAAMKELGLDLISFEDYLGQFDSRMLEKYFEFNLTHEDATERNTIFFHQIAALKSTAFAYLKEAKVDVHTLREDFRLEIEEYGDAVFRGRRMLGILIRGTDYINTFKSGPRQMSSPDEMVPMINEWMKSYGYECIFLATEDADVLEKMRNYYHKNLVAVSQKRHRVEELDGNLLLADLTRLRSKDPDEDLEENIVNYFYALYLLSRCHAFMCSGYCNGYDLVLHFNEGRYEHSYLFQKGEET